MHRSITYKRKQPICVKFRFCISIESNIGQKRKINFFSQFLLFSTHVKFWKKSEIFKLGKHILENFLRFFNWKYNSNKQKERSKLLKNCCKMPVLYWNDRGIAIKCQTNKCQSMIKVYDFIYKLFIIQEIRFK